MNGGHPYGDVHSNGDSAKVMYNGSYLHQQVPNLSNGDVLSKFELAKKEMLQQFVQLQKTTKALSTAFSGLFQQFLRCHFLKLRSNRRRFNVKNTVQGNMGSNKNWANRLKWFGDVIFLDILYLHVAFTLISKSNLTQCKRRTIKKCFLSDFSSTAGKIELDLDVKPVDNAVSQIDHINDVIARDQMKVVFFGR